MRHACIKETIYAYCLIVCLGWDSVALHRVGWGDALHRVCVGWGEIRTTHEQMLRRVIYSNGSMPTDA